MNHKQISDLKVGDILELKEDYAYTTDFGRQTIRKGTKLKMLYPFLGGWRFEFDRIQGGDFPYHISFGRSRLIKLKVKKFRSSEGRLSSSLTTEDSK